MIKLLAIDLFCGSGGLSLGLEQAGFNVVVAIDSWRLAVYNYNKNRKSKIAIVKDIRELDGDFIKQLCKIDDIPLIGGGPVCKGMSMSGKRNVLDPRNSLVDEFYRIIEEVRPRYFIMENVPGMKSMLRPDLKSTVLKWIERRINELRYKHSHAILNAAHYGVPQFRKRIMIVGWRNDVLAPVFPPGKSHDVNAYKTLTGKHIKKFVTVEEAFDSIPENAPNQDLVYTFKNPGYIKKVENLKPGKSVYEGGFSESHKRLYPDRPAFTIKENHGAIAIHPFENRMINLREMAILQGYPVDYEFIGSNRLIAKMIGNSVPPQMIKSIAINIRKLQQSKNFNI